MIAFGRELVTAWVWEAVLVLVVVLSSAMIWVGSQDSVTRVRVGDDDRSVGAVAGSVGNGAADDVIMAGDGRPAEDEVSGACEKSGDVDAWADDDASNAGGADADTVEDCFNGAVGDDWAVIVSETTDDGAGNVAEEDLAPVFVVEGSTLTDVEEGAEGGGTTEDKAAVALDSVALSTVEEGDNEGAEGATSWEEGMTETGALEMGGSSEEVKDAIGKSELGLGTGAKEEVDDSVGTGETLIGTYDDVAATGAELSGVGSVGTTDEVDHGAASGTWLE